MKAHFTLGLGLVSSLFCGTLATADFQGLDYKLTSTGAVGADTWTVDVYIVLDQGERLDAVAGDDKNNKTVATSGMFYQNAFGGPTSQSINPVFFPIEPDLVYDSWVTIGLRDNVDNALNNIGIDWTDFENGGDVFTDNGTWFVTPKDIQGEAAEFTNQNCESKFGVLVAQLTVIGLSENIYMNAKFQGKDANGITISTTTDITIWYPQITDCNNNGVDDSCDISNGTSNDDNGNGIPDECEFPDCNGNGIDDNVDIANGTSEDCNGNGIPDECEMANGDCNDNGILDECETFADCNDNGIPDECEVLGDCNNNGTPDECEDLQDWDGNGVPDACEGLVAYNTSNGTGYSDFDAAIQDSDDGDVIWVDAAYADTLAEMDFHGAAVDVLLLGGGSPSAAVQMAAGASLNVGNMSNLASVNSDTEGTATVSSDMHLHSTIVTVFRDSSLNLDAGHMILGSINQRMDSELSLDSPTTLVEGEWTCASGSTIYASSGVSMIGSMVGTFDLFGSMTNVGDLSATDDVLISGNLTNDGLVSIHRGVLYVLGDLTNNGTILGEVDAGPGFRSGEGNEPTLGDGMRVIGNYTAGANASLFMAHPNWQLAVGGNFDVSINDSANFIMNEATLKFIGHAGEQEVEVMGADYGGIEEALDPAYGCTFPIGNVIVASGAHVILVDNRENDCEGDLAEVMYVETLIIEAGATLDTNGLVIYVADYDNQGTIIGEDDVIIIDPPVYGDLNGDGVVNIDDMLIVIGQWGPCDGCAGDINGSGQADIDDLLIVIGNWS